MGLGFWGAPKRTHLSFRLYSKRLKPQTFKHEGAGYNLLQPLRDQLSKYEGFRCQKIDNSGPELQPRVFCTRNGHFDSDSAAKVLKQQTATGPPQYTNAHKLLNFWTLNPERNIIKLRKPQTKQPSRMFRRCFVLFGGVDNTYRHPRPKASQS